MSRRTILRPSAQRIKHLVDLRSRTYPGKLRKELTEAISEYEARPQSTGRAEDDFSRFGGRIRTESDRELRRCNLRKTRWSYRSLKRSAGRTSDKAARRRLARSATSITQRCMKRCAGWITKLLPSKPDRCFRGPRRSISTRLDEVAEARPGLAIEEAERSRRIILSPLEQLRQTISLPPDLLRVYRETMAGFGINIERRRNCHRQRAAPAQEARALSACQSRARRDQARHTTDGRPIGLPVIAARSRPRAALRMDVGRSCGQSSSTRAIMR